MNKTVSKVIKGSVIITVACDFMAEELVLENFMWKLMQKYYIHNIFLNFEYDFIKQIMFSSIDFTEIWLVLKWDWKNIEIINVLY